jgi:hypothetical protein
MQMSTKTHKPAEQQGGSRGVVRFLTNVLLFLASPFIALSYLVALPVVGMIQFVKAAREKKNPESRS